MPRALKRKREELEDSDEEPAPGKQILPVANLPEDFHGEPMDGMQYLFTVRRDARHLPHTTRASNPYETPETPFVPLPNESLRATHPAVPSEEWRASFEKHFRNFRRNVLQPTIHIHIPQNAKHKIIPEMRQRDCWWAFLAGRPESDWNPPKKSKSDASLRRRHYYGRYSSPDSDAAENLKSPQETWHINDEGEVKLALSDNFTESLPTPSGTPAPSERSGEAVNHLSAVQDQNVPPILVQREPTPSLMAHVDQRTALHLLMYFAHWINVHLEQADLGSSRITETHARWIFVLLSRVEDYISADDMSLLRNLARASLALLKVLLRKRNLENNGEEICRKGHSPSLPDAASASDHLPTRPHPQSPSTSSRPLSPTSPQSRPSIMSAAGQGFPSPRRQAEAERDADISERSCWIIITAIAGIWGQRDLWMDVDSVLAGLSS